MKITKFWLKTSSAVTIEPRKGKAYQYELETRLIDILGQFGDKYTISFKELEQLENAI